MRFVVVVIVLRTFFSRTYLCHLVVVNRSEEKLFLKESIQVGFENGRC